MFCALSLSKFVTVEGHHYHYHLRDLLFLVILNLVESLLSSNIIHDRISRVVEPIEYCLLGRISLFFLVPSVNSITSFRCLSVRPSIAYNHEYHIFFPSSHKSNQAAYNKILYLARCFRNYPSRNGEEVPITISLRMK